VTNVVHDHTSVLATIEAKWNLPACTYRDANATTMMDFLDPSRPALLEPPMLASAGNIAPGEEHCDTADPKLKVLGVTKAGRLIVRYHGTTKDRKGIRLELHTRTGNLANVHVALLHKGHVLATHTVKHVTKHHRHLVLHARHRLGSGAYTLRVRQGGRTLVRRTIHVQAAPSTAPSS